MTARGFEWSNHKSVVIGISEVVIYSGENRSIDIGYVNPISSHLEAELNNRLNILGNSNSNAVWQIHFDYLLLKNLRMSLNFLIDEFVIDRDIQKGKEHGKALSFRFAYSPSLKSNGLLTFHSSLVYVGTPTFRHKLGSNNFVYDRTPLGWYGGSDGGEFSLGINYYNQKNLILKLQTGIMINGEETITNRMYEPYKDYLRGPFPSGLLNNHKYLRTSFKYLYQNKYSVSTSIQKEKNNLLIQFAFNKLLAELPGI